LRNLPLVSWRRKSRLPTSLTMPSGFTGQLSSDSANQLSANAAEAPDCRGHREGIGRISIPGRDYMSEEPTENLAGTPPFRHALSWKRVSSEQVKYTARLPSPRPQKKTSRWPRCVTWFA
jgi:hypothetical protein